MLENIKIKGILEVVVRDAKTNRILQRNYGENLICVGMQNSIGAALVSGVDRHITKFAIGNGTDAPTFYDTALKGDTIVYLDPTQVTYSDGKITAITHVDASTGNFEISEYGLFGLGQIQNELVLLARKVYPPIQKSSNVVLDLAWYIKILTG